MTTEAKHTPGPWRSCGGYTPQYKAITSQDGYIVFGMADPYCHTANGAPIQAPPLEAQCANAKLIAKAPEMHNTLEAIRNDCLTWLEGERDSLSQNELLMAFVQAAEKAMAAAGEEAL